MGINVQLRTIGCIGDMFFELAIVEGGGCIVDQRSTWYLIGIRWQGRLDMQVSRLFHYLCGIEEPLGAEPLVY